MLYDQDFDTVVGGGVIIATNNTRDLDKTNRAIVANALGILSEYADLFIKKQKDYGPCNIADFGEFGVLVRLNDKVRRLKNLLQKGESPSNESVEDTWMDIIGYGLIGLMLHRGEWITDGCEEGK